MRNKFKGLARQWSEAQAARGVVKATWTGDDGLREAIRLRFAVSESVAATTQSLAELAIRTGEGPLDFLDRVEVTLSKLYKDKPLVQRQEAAFQETFNGEVFKWFSKGVVGTKLYESIFRGDGKVAVPEDYPALRACIDRLQLQYVQLRRTKGTEAALSELVGAVAPPAAADKEDFGGDVVAELAALKVKFERLQQGGSGGRRQRKKETRRENKCKHCGGVGHWPSECPNNRPYQPLQQQQQPQQQPQQGRQQQQSQPPQQQPQQRRMYGQGQQQPPPYQQRYGGRGGGGGHYSGGRNRGQGQYNEMDGNQAGGGAEDPYSQFWPEYDDDSTSQSGNAKGGD